MSLFLIFIAFYSLLQHASDKVRHFDSVPGFRPAVDLMFADVPEGLHVPTISAPPAPIPQWNEFHDQWLVPAFDFAEQYLHDKGAFIVMHPTPSVAHRAHILGCCQEYNFRVLHTTSNQFTWFGMNHLRLTSPVDPLQTVRLTFSSFYVSWKIGFCIQYLIYFLLLSLQTKRFGISLLVRDSGPKTMADFPF